MVTLFNLSFINFVEGPQGSVEYWESDLDLVTKSRSLLKRERKIPCET